ncbi:TauD/TfdA family dioxygenase [Stella sp.]|uniref:TauD/TfdA family dioxygenase n=1 Tax=Stella sp. TaxID=2912054 RepID=UPI0035B1113F
MTRIGGPAAWKGSEVDYRTEMMHRFTDGEVAEIDAALKACGERDIPEITTETFPLPGMGATMLRLRDELLDGRGVVLMRGFPRERYSADEMARIYVGLGVHLGRPVAQSWFGQLLGSVIDVSDIVEKVRGYAAGGGQHFHIDTSACDIVSLMCLRRALSGGASRIVSLSALHDHMLATRPDLLEVLYRGFYNQHHEMDARHAVTPPLSAERIPVMTQTAGRLMGVLDSGNLRYAVQQGGVTLSDVEIEAYDELQRLARSEEFFLDMNFEEGDIQFLNNRNIMHARTDYEDDPEVARRRHLLRLWLRVDSWPQRPPHQVFLTDADTANWLKNRRPFMEFPSRYLAEMTALQEKRRRENTLLRPEKPSGTFVSARGWQEARDRQMAAAG